MKTQSRSMAHPASWLMLTSPCIILGLSACKEDKDPSYEKEALKLSAEKAALEVRLEESKKQLEALQAQVQRAEDERDAIKAKASQASGKIDPEKIKVGFAKAVSELGQQIEQKHPDYSVASVTFQKMKMPTDYPFSSGVMTTIISKSSGEKRTLYWEAQGNTKGEWRFAQRSAPKKPTVADANPPSQPSGNPNDTSTASNPPSGQPSKPKQPAQPQSPSRPKPATNGKTHVIDWGKLR